MMAVIIRVVSGDRADRLKKRALVKSVKCLILNEHRELNVRECITFAGCEGTKHQDCHYPIVRVTDVSEALNHHVLKQFQGSGVGL